MSYKVCVLWEVMFCMNTCFMRGHAFMSAYLTGGCVLHEDISNRRTGLTGRYIL